MNMDKYFNSLGKKGYFCTVNETCSAEGKTVYSVETKEDTAHFCNLTKEEQEMVLTWLRYNVLPAKEPLYGHTSYGMKHTLETRTNIYLTNNQFKEAMLLCGFYPVETDMKNWNFYVKKSSPIFQDQTDGKPGLPMMGGPMDYRNQ